jgi:NADH dehydrogenase
VRGDITDPGTLGGALDGVETVIHAAAITGDRKEPYRGAYDRVNRQGTENLAAAAKAAGVKRLVVMSGLGCRAAPAGTYMATRWGLEEAVRGGGIPYVILQPSLLFGPGAPFAGALANLARWSPVLPALGGGGTRFQPLWIEDLVTCVLACTAGTLRADLLNAAHPLGGAEILTFREILRVITGALGKRRLIVPLPLAVASIQARVMVALLPNPPLTPAAIELFGFENATDLDSVERRFGFQPKGFREDPGI